MPEHITVRIARIDQELTEPPLPAYATDGSAGMDLCASMTHDIMIKPGKTALIPTGFCIELPLGFEAQVRPRSGLALKHSIGILNSPGTIDSDYRGEVKVILANFGASEFVVRKGDRIAQLVVARYARVNWEPVHDLAVTSRGVGGFGHTGVGSEETRRG